jgi:hypothetical protein
MQVTTVALIAVHVGASYDQHPNHLHSAVFHGPGQWDLLLAALVGKIDVGAVVEAVQWALAAVTGLVVHVETMAYQSKHGMFVVDDFADCVWSFMAGASVQYGVE